MVKKAINVRIDRGLLQDFDKLPGSRTDNLEAAMKAYLHRGAGVENRIDTVEQDQLRAEVKAKEELLAAQADHIETLKLQLGWYHQYALPGKKVHWWSKLRKK
jgi:hypothetical protein